MRYRSCSVYRRLIIGALLAFPSVSFATDTIIDLMSEQERRDTGVDSLSPSQIQALSEWLTRYTAHTAPMERLHNEAVREEISNADHAEITSTIRGAFSGWSGATVFRLANGQIWKQRVAGRWSIKLDSPEVSISKNMFGMWEIQIPEYGRSVGVKRIH